VGQPHRPKLQRGCPTGRQPAGWDERANLLVDDTARVWDFVRSRPRRRLVIIADNAGTELLMDLALVDFLLSEGLVERVALHVKQQPFFVSDTMPRDVEAGLAALSRGDPAARALASAPGSI